LPQLPPFPNLSRPPWKEPSEWTRNKQERRERLERELGARIRALPDKLYGVVLAYPPARFEVYSRVTGMNRAAENQHRCAATPITPDCRLYTLVGGTDGVGRHDAGGDCNSARRKREKEVDE
jgi:hypothetical protein